MSETLYLSRRNLQSLLNKLDRQAKGEETACTLIKYRIETDPFVQTMETCKVMAIEDKDYYNRAPGDVHPADDPGLKT